MLPYIAFAILSLVLLSTIRRYHALKRNIALAEASGLPYIVQRELLLELDISKVLANMN